MAILKSGHLVDAVELRKEKRGWFKKEEYVLIVYKTLYRSARGNYETQRTEWVPAVNVFTD